MQVAYVNADGGVPAFGSKGGSIHIQEVIRAFCKRNTPVHLLTSLRGGDIPADLASIRISDIDRLANDYSERASRLSFRKAVQSLNKNLIDALTTGNRNSHFDLIYERYSLWSCAAMEWARERGVRSVLEVNAPLIEEQNRYRIPVDSELAHQVADRAFISADTLIAVSQEVADYLYQFAGTRDKICVIPNGVNPDRFLNAINSMVPISDDMFTIGFVGSFKPWHGLEVLVEALARLNLRDSKFRLLIVGEGPERSRTEALAVRKGVAASVHFTGAVLPNEIPSLLSAMNIAVAPYPKIPNFYFSPLKVFEYMAGGLPVVASDIGQIKVIIEHGLTGWLVPPGDAQALADAIEYLRRQPELRFNMGQAARSIATAKHTWASVVDRIIKFSQRETTTRPSSAHAS